MHRNDLSCIILNTEISYARFYISISYTLVLQPHYIICINILYMPHRYVAHTASAFLYVGKLANCARSRETHLRRVDTWRILVCRVYARARHINATFPGDFYEYTLYIPLG